MKNVLLILVCVVLGVGGQLLLKQGMSADRDVVDRVSEVLPRLLKAALNPVVIAGFVLYALSAALWLIVLTRAELSWAYPMLSLGYVINAAAAHYLFGEVVSVTRWLGIGFIILGVWLVARN